VMEKTTDVRIVPLEIWLIFSGNPDGQAQTDFGKLSSFNTPWVVIPDSYFQSHNVPKNALSVVICNGKMFYGIMGDTDGDHPQVIGEASVLMGKACFPDEHLGGNNGHTALDVLCIFPQWRVELM
jgi:chitosanase